MRPATAGEVERMPSAAGQLSCLCPVGRWRRRPPRSDHAMRRRRTAAPGLRTGPGAALHIVTETFTIRRGIVVFIGLELSYAARTSKERCKTMEEICSRSEYTVAAAKAW
ncbi:MAG: hypothetical protein AW07_02065 [Candidatus Accumulibacter sp. SK-11]|nr:MAG: hypothetical protein AW07_02065 [Candidatus Accumulibacter sp. SK-11]